MRCLLVASRSQACLCPHMCLTVSLVAGIFGSPALLIRGDNVYCCIHYFLLSFLIIKWGRNVIQKQSADWMAVEHCSIFRFFPAPASLKLKRDFQKLWNLLLLPNPCFSNISPLPLLSHPRFPTALTFAKTFSFWPLWFSPVSPGNLGLGTGQSLLLDLENALGQSFWAGEVIMKASSSGWTPALQSVALGISACVIFEGSEVSLFSCPVRCHLWPEQFLLGWCCYRTPVTSFTLKQRTSVSQLLFQCPFTGITVPPGSWARNGAGTKGF